MEESARFKFVRGYLDMGTAAQALTILEGLGWVHGEDFRLEHWEDPDGVRGWELFVREGLVVE